jgi:hypothetical protein
MHMRFGTILTKFGAASVAAVLTIGGGLAFAEGGDGTTDGGTTDSTEVVTTPTEGGTVTIPVEGDGVVIDGGTTDGTVTEGTVTDGTESGEVDGGGDVVVDPVETVEPVEEEPVHVKPENHGKYVSAAAKTAPKGKGGVHGKAVSQVAKSDQGKKHSAPVDNGTADDETASTSSKAPASKGGKGHGKK